MRKEKDGIYDTPVLISCLCRVNNIADPDVRNSYLLGMFSINYIIITRAQYSLLKQTHFTPFRYILQHPIVEIGYFGLSSWFQ